MFSLPVVLHCPSSFHLCLTVCGFSQEHKVLLTGTPLQNTVEELFSLLHFLEPAQFPSETEFLRDFGDLKTEEQVWNTLTITATTIIHLTHSLSSPLLDVIVLCCGPLGSEAAGHPETHDVAKAQGRCWEELGTQTGDHHWGLFK